MTSNVILSIIKSKLKVLKVTLWLKLIFFLEKIESCIWYLMLSMYITFWLVDIMRGQIPPKHERVIYKNPLFARSV